MSLKQGREKIKETKGGRDSRSARTREVGRDDVDSGSTKTIAPKKERRTRRDRKRERDL